MSSKCAPTLNRDVAAQADLAGTDVLQYRRFQADKKTTHALADGLAYGRK